MHSVHLKFLATGSVKPLARGSFNTPHPHKSIRINSYHGFKSNKSSASAFTQIVNNRSLSHKRRSSVVVHALFEKFTERSIKSVMLSQEICREFGDKEVRFNSR